MKVVSEIKNKIKREDVYHKQKAEKAKLKLQRRMQLKKDEAEDEDRKKQRLQENVPQTLESLREADDTLVGNDEEVFADEDCDEFASYFNQGLVPKILVSTSRRAHASVYAFAQEFTSIFPEAQFVNRGPQFEVKRMVEIAIERKFTDLIIINEDRKQPNTLTLIHLPDGPTATFKLSSIKLNSDIRGHGRVAAHKPELILNNFNTRLGHTVGRMLAALFPHVPEFEGRQVATFHNQRDFIFFRRHRYAFRNGERCDIQELGPRFTLKLQSLQRGTFDTKFGDYEWMHKPELDTSRRKFHL